MNGMIRALPTQSRIKELLNYDPDTGTFSRAKSQGKSKPGNLAGTVSCGYLAICVDYVVYRAHRLAWVYMTGEDPGDFEIDHINLDRLDNRWVNLRLADRAGNAQNCRIRKFNTSGFKGVYFDKSRNKYSAEIVCRKIKYRLGRFDTLKEAADAYAAAAKSLHGEFAGPD